MIHRELTAAVDTLEQATQWMLEHGLGDPVQALSAATPYQRLFATAVAGWLMAVSAVAAKRLLDAGAGDADVSCEAKLVTTRFFAQHLLPQVHGLLAAGHRRQGRPLRPHRRRALSGHPTSVRVAVVECGDGVRPGGDRSAAVDDAGRATAARPGAAGRA